VEKIDNMNINKKATDIFEFYYAVIPYTHTNKQRAEVALKCSLNLVDEVLQLDINNKDMWNEVKTILKSKIK
jgi:hypothetical protein